MDDREVQKVMKRSSVLYVIGCLLGIAAGVMFIISMRKSARTFASDNLSAIYFYAGMILSVAFAVMVFTAILQRKHLHFEDGYTFNFGSKTGIYFISMFVSSLFLGSIVQDLFYISLGVWFAVTIILIEVAFNKADKRQEKRDYDDSDSEILTGAMMGEMMYQATKKKEKKDGYFSDPDDSETDNLFNYITEDEMKDDF